MKKRLSILLALLLLVGNFLAVPAAAEGTGEEGSTPSGAPTESKPTEPAPSEEPKPTESKPAESEPTTPTQGSTPTEPSTPACTAHTYGDWEGDEGSHWHSCTKCGHRESAGHSWASELITVAPTCKDPGGKCKICTVCEGVLVTEIIPATTTHTYDKDCDDTCNVCSAKREVTHTFGKTWTYNGKGHWHTCTLCGAAGEVKAHYPGPAATEEKDQICLTCGMIMMRKKPHAHKWDTKWSSDESSHWYVCTVCQEKDKTAAHTYDDGCDADCNDCGYIRTTAHTYGADWIQTEMTHSHVCTVCGEETPAEDHVADSTGTKCGICSYAMEAMEETHVHEFDPETWGFDENGHWNTCICGEKDHAEPHTWDEGEKKGKQILHTCEICGAEKTEEAPVQAFPWLLVAAGGGILICLAGIVVCIIVLRRSREEDA